jgi:F-type H+-transporting ATPase subunit b
MKQKKSRKRVWAFLGGCSLWILLFSFGFALASEGGGHGGAQESVEMTDLLSRTINFILLVVILYFAMRKAAVKDFFKGRREEIRKKLDELRKGKEEAEQRYSELEKKLKEFEAKRAEIVEQFKAEGLSEKERIIAEARERAKQMVAQAELTVQREIQVAKNRLEAELFDIAAQKAREIIVREIKEDDQDHLINEFIERVEKLH